MANLKPIFRYFVYVLTTYQIQTVINLKKFYISKRTPTYKRVWAFYILSKCSSKISAARKQKIIVISFDNQYDLSCGAQVNNIERTFLRKQNKRSEYKATQSQSTLSINPNRRVRVQETTDSRAQSPHNARVCNEL
jgi:hypothetical protein